MILLQILPIIAYGLAGAAIFAIVSGTRPAAAQAWLLPAGLAVLLGAFTTVTVLREGIVVFWDNHTVNLAGNQVWFDLVIAVVLCFALIAPRARAVGMKLAPWGIAVLATASVALLPMFARLLWLERRRRPTD